MTRKPLAMPTFYKKESPAFKIKEEFKINVTLVQEIC